MKKKKYELLNNSHRILFIGYPYCMCNAFYSFQDFFWWIVLFNSRLTNWFWILFTQKKTQFAVTLRTFLLFRQWNSAFRTILKLSLNFHNFSCFSLKILSVITHRHCFVKCVKKDIKIKYYNNESQTKHFLHKIKDLLKTSENKEYF